MSALNRTRHGGLFGPTTGDRVRLADTALVVEVERDLTVAGEMEFGPLAVCVRSRAGSARAAIRRSTD